MEVTRAEEVSVGPARMTIRSPAAIWVLSFFTLGIWMVVWTYQVTRELRDYSRAVTRPFGASPVVASALAAAWPFGLWPGMLGALVNGRRAGTAGQWVGSPAPARGIVAALLFPVFFAHTWYLQAKLNDVWRHARDGKGPPPDHAVASHAEQALASRSHAEAEGRGYRWR